ncbi:hypothetical protein EYF80_001227 [Liparis tanakae]|uniref:Uncharacterized protein n=1 Tax=Liparis tanakae TaxID=230148 RepID=A0A4Z2JDU1_9TELE|nr:hypothetical protein EYF80_001227 [Liparis tanakae]
MLLIKGSSGFRRDAPSEKAGGRRHGLGRVDPAGGELGGEVVLGVEERGVLEVNGNWVAAQDFCRSSSSAWPFLLHHHLKPEARMKADGICVLQDLREAEGVGGARVEAREQVGGLVAQLHYLPTLVGEVQLRDDLLLIGTAQNGLQRNSPWHYLDRK